MPLKKACYVGAYTPDQLDTLQSTYNEVCAILGECPTSGERRDVIAKGVIRLTEQGEKDPRQIAHTIRLISPVIY